MYFIGVDIGTTSVKIVAIDETGEIIKSISKNYPIFFPKPLWSEQHPEDWWNQSIEGLKELLAAIDKTKVRAISFSGQMHGLVVLDEYDQVIRPAILWNDQRTEKECSYLNDEIGREKIAAWTGNMALAGFTAPKILWLRENEAENYKKIDKIMLPKDYLVYRMTGHFVTDMSDASGTLILDVKNRRWSDEMCEILGIRKNQLPELHESFEAIGSIREEIAESLGLDSSVKIVIGGGDQAVAAIGGGIVGLSSCSVSLGTSGVVFANTEQYLMDKDNRLHSFCNANGKYHVMGVTLSAAASLKWWVENVNNTSDYDGLLDEIAESQIEENIYFLPYLMGERTPHNDSNARGTFIGMDMSTNRCSMTRAVLEGVGFSLRDSFEIMKDMGMRINEVTINGGGAKNSLWCQMIADILNVKVIKVNSDDGPAYGAAILASVGDGLFDNLDEACEKFIDVTESFQPNESIVEIYNRKYSIYRSLYPELKNVFKRLNQVS